VVPQLTYEYERMSGRYFADSLAVVSPALKTGMPIRIENPHELGTDRLVNAVAGYDRCGSACIVADFGTSLNYDVVSPQGEYLGGVISPGVEISIEALARRAARLFPVDLEAPKTVIGKSTLACLQSGVVYGFAGQVDGIVARIREELGEEATAIATGGQAGAIAPFCDQIDEVDDLLTLTGLRLVWERNRD
jgi:type III pantothenate kinase